MKKSFRLLACMISAAALVVALVAISAAQSTSTIVGTVVDPHGAVAPNVTVTLGDSATYEVIARATTNNEGFYSFSSVRPGKYTITARLAGLGSRRIDVEVTNGASIRTDITLERLPTAAARPNGGPATTENYAVVKVFYATDRRPTGKPEPKRVYANERAGDEKLSFGICSVSIPREHRMGHLEGPSIWKLEFRENPGKHVVLLSVEPQEKTDFYGALTERVTKSETKQAFVFIHGYAVTFEDAARRTAQLSYDLGFDGAPILYSWPSKGKVSAYAADEATIGWTAPHLKEFLEEVAQRSQATTVHLVAHSMGNRALAEALKSLATETEASARPLPQFRHVVLAAPDIDAGVFRQLAKAMAKTAERVTLYASAEDEALVASRKFHDYPRAGESGQGIVVVPGVDTIDVSAVDTGLLGHSYYGENRSVMSDMFYLLKEGKPPSQRAGLSPVQLGEATYWKFRP